MRTEEERWKDDGNNEQSFQFIQFRCEIIFNKI